MWGPSCVTWSVTLPARVDCYILQLPNCMNFRDMGGVRLSDGHVIAEHLFYRSGRLDRLTAGEQELLLDLGIRRVVDIRSEDEKHRHPDRIPDTITYIEKPAEIVAFSLGAVIQLFRLTAAGNCDPDQYVLDNYARMPFILANLFAELFRLLLEADTHPLLLHCTGGKDRTGLFSALFLYALGADTDTVMEDYLLSGHRGDDLANVSRRYAASFSSYGVSIRPELTYPFLTAEKKYLESALNAIRRKCGSIPAYLRHNVGLSPAEMERLRAIFIR